MLVSFVFALLLAQDPNPQTAASGPNVAQAAAMAQEGREEDALVAFQRMAAANPDDHLARLWIARIQERMGYAARAEAVYRSVLLEDASNVQAMLGVGTTLLARDEADDALEVLESAERLEPQNADVLAAVARAHAMKGRDLQSIAYLQRVVTLAPTDQNLLALENARRAYLHRFEARFGAEQFSGNIPTTRAVDIRGNLRLKDSLRVFGRVDIQKKFNVNEQRFGGGAEWRWTPATTLIGHAIIGPDNRVMPEADYLGEIDHTYRSSGWTGTFRYIDFTGARVFVLSPAMRHSLTDRLAAGIAYALALTETSITAGTAKGHTLMLRGDYRLSRRYSVTGGYTRGVESFETYSIEQIGDFHANTLSGGVRVQLPSLLSLAGTYQRQWRRDSADVHRFVAAMSQRF